MIPIDQLDLVHMFQSDNLLLGMEGQVKITDFGFASKIQASKSKYMRAFQINDMFGFQSGVKVVGEVKLA